MEDVFHMNLFTESTGSPSSKYVVYATACVYRELYRKIADRRKICPKICLFGFPEVLVKGSATTAVRKVVSSSTLFGPFKI